MATPHVSGVAALVWSYFPKCTNEQIRYALAASAADEGASGCDAYFGQGIVQAVAAYKWLASHSCSGASWGQTASQGGCYNL
jgi:serine protease